MASYPSPTFETLTLHGTPTLPAHAATKGMVDAVAAAAGGSGSYTLPAATTMTLGGVKAGAGTAIAGDGTLSVAGGGAAVPVTVVAASGASQALAFPASGSAAYDLTLTANCTLSLTGGTAGQQQTITVYLRQDSTAGRVVTLPAGVRWPGGVAPTPGTAAGGVDVFVFATPDARATVIGSY